MDSILDLSRGFSSMMGRAVKADSIVGAAAGWFEQQSLRSLHDALVVELHGPRALLRGHAPRASCLGPCPTCPTKSLSI